MRLIDIHAHLPDVPDVDGEIERARDNGLVAIIANGMDEKSNEVVMNIWKRHPDIVIPAQGLHPLVLKDNFEKPAEMLEAGIERAVAIGEVGMDFRYKTPRELQVKAFMRVLDIAARHDKPLIIHSRTAWREVVEMLKKSGARRAAFHWYTGPLDIMQEILDFGGYISASPAAEFSEPHRLAIKEVPLDRLLLETDSPVEYRGVPSTPSDVLKTLKAVAELKGIDENKIAKATTENATKMFDLKL